MILESNSPKETQKIAADLARKIIKTKKGAIIALEGELGAGKTVFVKGFAKALGVKSKIKSPTFVLMKKYQVSGRGEGSRAKPGISVGINLYHLDCYRVGDYENLKIPELKEIIEDSKNIVLIEWAERIRKILPKKFISVHIDHVSENERKISIT